MCRNKTAGENIPAWKGDTASDRAGFWRNALHAGGFPEYAKIEAEIIAALDQPAADSEDLGELWVCVGGFLGYAGGSYADSPIYVSERVVGAALTAVGRMLGAPALPSYLASWRDPTRTLGELHRYRAFLKSLIQEGRGTTFEKETWGGGVDEHRLLFLISDNNLLHIPMLSNGHRLSEEDKIEIVSSVRVAHRWLIGG